MTLFIDGDNRTPCDALRVAVENAIQLLEQGGPPKGLKADPASGLAHARAKLLRCQPP